MVIEKKCNMNMNEKLFEKDKVSVVIPVYNEERFLLQTLESVIDQVDCVIIGDNASTDGTENICREFAEKHPHVIYLRNGENLGIYENVKQCILKVQTEFFFHLGGHDIVPSNYVLSLKKKLCETGDALGAYSDRHEVELDGSIHQRHPAKLCKTIFDDKGRSWPEYSMLPSPMERAANVYLSVDPDNYWHSLYRTELTLPYWKKLKADGSANYFFDILLRGKMVYCEDTVYYRRNVHPDDTFNEFQKRTLGEKFAHLEKPTYTEARIQRFRNVLNLFLDTVDPDLQDHEKLDVFRRLYSKLKQDYQFKTLELKCDRNENLFLLKEQFRMDRQAGLRSILRFFCTVTQHENKTSYKFFNGPSISIRKSYLVLD